MFTPRSFRHYQTLGCIDAPERSGKQVLYRLRHFLQALLVRKLLWERVSSERIVALIAGRSTEEIRQMLVDNREAVGAVDSVATSGVAETWKRIVVAPGVELHLRGDLPKPRPGEVEELLAKVESVLRN